MSEMVVAGIDVAGGSTAVDVVAISSIMVGLVVLLVVLLAVVVVSAFMKRFLEEAISWFLASSNYFLYLGFRLLLRI